MFAFIRRKGYAEEDAKDLTQQFFTPLLERKDFQRIDARKGKFRTFLLTVLTHFLANELDRAAAAKRGGGKLIFSLAAISPEEFQRFEPATDLSPNKLFDQRWAITLLKEAVKRLREEMAAGRADQFELLKAFLSDDPDEGDYETIPQKLDTTSQSVAVMVHRLRRRYRELVRIEVAIRSLLPPRLSKKCSISARRFTRNFLPVK